MNNKKGFYAIFVVCMVLIFGYGLLLTMKNLQALREVKKEAPAQTSNNNTYVNTDAFTEKTGSSQTASKKEEVAIQPNSKQKTSQESSDKSTAKTMNKNAAAQGAEKKTASNNEAVRDDGPKVAVFNPVEKMIVPVSGKVLVGFGDQYSEVTGEWVFNDGVELSTKPNEKVKAVLSGKVINVGSNENEGIFIILDHGDGLKTKYSNLATNKLVNVGQSVKKGDVISKAAQTYALGSFTDQTHIHFSVQQDGDYIDPLAKLPK